MLNPVMTKKGFGDLIRPAVEPAVLTIGAIITTAGIIKLPKYTKEKLYILLSNHREGIPMPRKYSRKLKQKYFPGYVIWQETGRSIPLCFYLSAT